MLNQIKMCQKIKLNEIDLYTQNNDNNNNNP